MYLAVWVSEHDEAEGLLLAVEGPGDDDECAAGGGHELVVPSLEEPGTPAAACHPGLCKQVWQTEKAQTLAN